MYKFSFFNYSIILKNTERERIVYRLKNLFFSLHLARSFSNSGQTDKDGSLSRSELYRSRIKILHYTSFYISLFFPPPPPPLMFYSNRVIRVTWIRPFMELVNSNSDIDVLLRNIEIRFCRLFLARIGFGGR